MREREREREGERERADAELKTKTGIEMDLISPTVSCRNKKKVGNLFFAAFPKSLKTFQRV